MAVYTRTAWRITSCAPEPRLEPTAGAGPAPAPALFGETTVSDHHHDEDYSKMSDAFLGHALTPQNLGLIPQPDGFASPKGTCGDFIELYLRVDDDTIRDARFMTEGCLHTVACGSALTSLIKSRPLNQAAKVDADTIEAELGGLDADHRHCAELAERTLKEALRDYFRKKQSPWQQPFEQR